MNLYKRHRFPPDIISYAVWLYHRFNLSHRDIEDLLAERGITVSYESIRLWCIKFGPGFAKRLRGKHRGFGDTFYIDEVFLKIGGKQHYLWRAVDQDGDVIDVFLQGRRVARAAKRFFRRLIRRRGAEPWKIVTDKLGSYRVAHRAWAPDSIHVTERYGGPQVIVTDRLRSYGAAMKVIGVEDRQRCGRWLNNRAENSHPPFRRRERAMARFRDVIFTTARTSNSIAPPLWPSGVNLRPERPRLLVLLSDPVSLTMPFYEIDHILCSDNVGRIS